MNPPLPWPIGFSFYTNTCRLWPQGTDNQGRGFTSQGGSNSVSQGTLLVLQEFLDNHGGLVSTEVLSEAMIRLAHHNRQLTFLVARLHEEAGVEVGAKARKPKVSQGRRG